MGEFLKKFAGWAVRKTVYLVAAAAAVYGANLLGAHEHDILGLRLDVAVGGLSAVVMSELRRNVLPALLAVLLSGEVPEKY